MLKIILQALQNFFFLQVDLAVLFVVSAWLSTKKVIKLIKIKEKNITKCISANKYLINSSLHKLDNKL